MKNWLDDDQEQEITDAVNQYASKSEMRRVEYMKAARAMTVLEEFVTDIEAVYGIDCFNDDEFEGEWPDLAVTYRKAKEVLLAT